MKKLKELFNKYAPKLLGIILIAIMFVGSTAILIYLIKWLLKLLGVL